MEVIIAVLLCALGFAAYLLHSIKKTVALLQDRIREQENALVQLKQTLLEHEDRLRRLSPAEVKSSPPEDKRFVQVIFTPDSKNRYDYFLGNNPDIKIGDFVEVYVTDKDGGKPKWSVAKVVYISEPGEVSEYAKSKIKRKSARRKW